MSNYIKPNVLFRGWIDDSDNIIEIPRGREHHEKKYVGDRTINQRIKEDKWIRFYSDKIDIGFEVYILDNFTFKRIYNFFIKYLKGDIREIFIQDKDKMKQYKPQFKENIKQKYQKFFEMSRKGKQEMKERYKKYFESIDKHKPYGGLLFSGYKSKRLLTINQAIMIWTSGTDIKIEYYNIKSDHEKLVLMKNIKNLYNHLKLQEKQFENEYIGALKIAVKNNLSDEQFPDRNDFYNYEIPHDYNLSIETRKGYDILDIQPKNLNF